MLHVYNIHISGWNQWIWMESPQINRFDCRGEVNLCAAFHVEFNVDTEICATDQLQPALTCWRLRERRAWEQKNIIKACLLHRPTLYDPAVLEYNKPHKREATQSAVNQTGGDGTDTFPLINSYCPVSDQEHKYSLHHQATSITYSISWRHFHFVTFCSD